MNKVAAALILVPLNLIAGKIQDRKEKQEERKEKRRAFRKGRRLGRRES